MKDEKVVPIGRALGFLVEAEGRKLFSVGNGIAQIELPEFEYILWNHLRKFDSLTDWKKVLTAKVKKYPNINLDTILKKYETLNLMKQWQFDHVEDPELIGIYVTRNGYAHGEIEGKWVIGDQSTTHNVTLTKAQYILWNAAAGGATLLQVVDTVMTKLNLTEEEALFLLNKQGYLFVQLGYWNTEYLDFLIQGDAR